MKDIIAMIKIETNGKFIKIETINAIIKHLNKSNTI